MLWQGTALGASEVLPSCTKPRIEPEMQPIGASQEFENRPVGDPFFFIFYPAYTIEPGTFGTVPETTNSCGFFFLSVEYLLWLKTLAPGAF